MTSHGPPSGPEYPMLHVQTELPASEVLSLGQHTELPASEVVSLGQSMHVKRFVAPVSSEYFPAAQAVHSTESVHSILCFPGTHAVQAAASGPIY